MLELESMAEPLLRRSSLSFGPFFRRLALGYETNPENGAEADPETCEIRGQGFEALCTVWTDPEFDPEEPAFYYARVLENPSCRWSTYECNRLDPGDRPAACSDRGIAKIVQERAWASPIWYRPNAP